VPRVLAVIAALGLTLALLAHPASGEARETSTIPSPTIRDDPAPVTGRARIVDSAAVVEGIDVSHHQGRIDWARVASAGKRFAYVRASAGTLTADRTYRANRSRALAAGLTVGSYHFANPSAAPGDAAAEATWFLRNATIASGDLRPVLDLEVANGLPATALFTWAQTWLTAVERATGVKPLIYTTPKFWIRSMANAEWFARNGYALWVAHWTSAEGPFVPASTWAGEGWALWQTSSTGSVPGISGRVDLDRFAGATLTSEVLVP
jgi:lysozyme